MVGQDCSDPVSVCVFCVSWKLMLDCKLKQSSREGLRKHFSKVKYGSIIISHTKKV